MFKVVSLDRRGLTDKLTDRRSERKRNNVDQRHSPRPNRDEWKGEETDDGEKKEVFIDDEIRSDVSMLVGKHFLISSCSLIQRMCLIFTGCH